MDIADDITYSTYDLEDSIKATFLSPVTMMSMSDEFKQKICDETNRKLEKQYADVNAQTLTVEEINNVIADMFVDVFDVTDVKTRGRRKKPITIPEASMILSSASVAASEEIVLNGYLRTEWTSKLVGRFVRGVEVIKKDRGIHLCNARLMLDPFKEVEIRKLFSYNKLIMSPRVKIAEIRGREIISVIFKKLMENPELMPEDWGGWFHSLNDRAWKRRVVCDFMAGMTDRYCVEFFARITGIEPPSIHKPH